MVKKISRSLERELVLMYMLDTSVRDLCLIYGLVKADVIDALMKDKQAAGKRRLEVSTSVPKRRNRNAV